MSINVDIIQYGSNDNYGDTCMIRWEQNEKKVAIMIDVGFKNDGVNCWRECGKPELLFVLITHLHSDHVEGLHNLVDAYSKEANDTNSPTCKGSRGFKEFDIYHGGYKENYLYKQYIESCSSQNIYQLTSDSNKNKNASSYVEKNFNVWHTTLPFTMHVHVPYVNNGQATNENDFSIVTEIFVDSNKNVIDKNEIVIPTVGKKRKREDNKDNFLYLNLADITPGSFSKLTLTNKVNQYKIIKLPHHGSKKNCEPVLKQLFKSKIFIFSETFTISFIYSVMMLVIDKINCFVITKK